MTHKRYIIYCDESVEKGRYYSHFYGGALIAESERIVIEEELNLLKTQLNFHSEVKWTKVSEAYLQKYIQFINKYFDLIENGFIKIRIMFIQNIYTAIDLDEYQIDNQYFMLYYQMLKHSFGIRYCNPDAMDKVSIAILLDDIPDNKEKFENFKNYLSSLSDYPVFTNANVRIDKQDITDVNSKHHVILQGMDIILGAMQFRLNDKHKEKLPDSNRRGKRTRAKEALYKHIYNRIRQIYPHFNIGISTGAPNGTIDRWNHPYRHWSFVPNSHEVDKNRSKKKSPT